MRYEKGYRSRHVEDRRGSGGGGLGGMLGGSGGGGAIKIGGGMGIPLLLLILLFTQCVGDGSGDLGAILGELGTATQGQGGGLAADGQDTSVGGNPCEGADFECFVFDDANETWEAIFADSDLQYNWPGLVLYTGGTQTAGCGYGQSAYGPFYCPADSKVYLDLSFFDTMAARLGAGGDFAQAYVIAHEVGHHVQNELGVSSQVRQQQQANPGQANQLNVQMELQADCFAGVWAYSALDDDQFEGGLLESGDLEEALNAAEAIGDDALQGPNANPESFTHGTSAQRRQWFATGYETGNPNACNTFEQVSG